GTDLHARHGLAGARRAQQAGALDLDHADAADVRRRQGLAVAERRRRDPELVQAVEDRLPFEHLHRLAVDLELDHAPRRPDQRHRSAPSRSMADSIALDAVWPRPQIDASRMHWPTSRISSSSSPRAWPFTIRASASCWRTVPTRHGTH